MRLYLRLCIDICGVNAAKNQMLLNVPFRTGISSVLFEKRIGCLENKIPDGTQHFINSIAQMFANSAGVILLPKWAHRFSPHWHRYVAGWDGIFTFGMKVG